MTKKLKGIQKGGKNGDLLPQSDLACECSGAMSGDTQGTVSRKEKICGLNVATLEILDERGEAACGRKIGTYITLYCPLMKNLAPDCEDSITEALSQIIKSFCEKLTKRRIDEKTRVLVAGIGNRFITADALGPRVADKVAVTAHVMDSGILDGIGCSSISAIHPGVMGQTGIEAAGLIRGAAKSINPHVVLAIDALAARSTDRLSATIQLSDTGIEPGSGIGNKRLPISRETVGYPVIAIGVPTVVDSATLVYDALEAAGTHSNGQMQKILQNRKSFFVSPKESDIICDTVSTIVAGAINRAFSAEGL